MNNLEIMLFLLAGYAFLVFTHLRLDALATENEKLLKKGPNTNLQD